MRICASWKRKWTALEARQRRDVQEGPLRTDAAWWLMLGLGAPPLLPLVAVRELGDSHAGADADDLQTQRALTLFRHADECQARDCSPLLRNGRYHGQTTRSASQHLLVKGGDPVHSHARPTRGLGVWSTRRLWCSEAAMGRPRAGAPAGSRRPPGGALPCHRHVLIQMTLLCSAPCRCARCAQLIRHP